MLINIWTDIFTDARFSSSLFPLQKRLSPANQYLKYLLISLSLFSHFKKGLPWCVSVTLLADHSAIVEPESAATRSSRSGSWFPRRWCAHCATHANSGDFCINFKSPAHTHTHTQTHTCVVGWLPRRWQARIATHVNSGEYSLRTHTPVRARVRAYKHTGIVLQMHDFSVIYPLLVHILVNFLLASYQN